MNLQDPGDRKQIASTITDTAVDFLIQGIRDNVDYLDLLDTLRHGYIALFGVNLRTATNLARMTSQVLCERLGEPLPYTAQEFAQLGALVISNTP